MEELEHMKFHEGFSSRIFARIDKIDAENVWTRNELEHLESKVGSYGAVAKNMLELAGQNKQDIERLRMRRVDEEEKLHIMNETICRGIDDNAKFKADTLVKLDNFFDKWNGQLWKIALMNSGATLGTLITIVGSIAGILKLMHKW